MTARPCDECGQLLGSFYYRILFEKGRPRNLCIACHAEIFEVGKGCFSQFDTEKV